MCMTCLNETVKEIVFTADIGINLVICVDCLNSNSDFSTISKGWCEECKSFHNKELIRYEEYEGQYLCCDCYWEYQNRENDQEEARANFYTHANLGIK